MTQPSPTAHLDLISGMLSRYAYAGDIKTALKWVLPQITELLDAEAGSVFMVDDTTSFLECIYSCGPVPFTGTRLEINEGLAGHCFRTSKAIFTPQASDDSRHAHQFDKASGFTTRNILTAPISSGDRHFGVFQLLNSRPCMMPQHRKHEAHYDTSLSLLELAGTLAAQALLIIELNHALVQDQILKRDLEQAIQIQTLLLRPSDLPEFMAAFSYPAQTLGGDFYDVSVTECRICFCFGDVAGKGISAALIMASCISLFRTADWTHHTAEDFILRLNNYLLSVNTDRFVAFTLVALDRYSNTAKIYCCGHSETALITSGQTPKAPTIEWLAALMPPLGIVGLKWEDIRCYHRTIGTQQNLVCFSDGITEAFSKKGAWGQASLDTFLKQNCIRNSAKLTAAHIKHLFDNKILISHDDVTMICLCPQDTKSMD